jgi:hypothetical protein
VDRGTIATSVTLLEGLIRGSDAFIAIYPFPEDAEVTPERLKNESRYFRLELGLAERADKPALAFIDSEFGNVIALHGRLCKSGSTERRLCLTETRPAQQNLKNG